MGLFNKIKNVFVEYEEEEEIEPKGKIAVKVNKVDKLPDSKRESKKSSDNIDDVISEREFFQKRVEVKKPIIFDEKDLVVNNDSLNNKKKDVNTKKVEKKKNYNKKIPKIEKEVKKFKPTPIISPVYGVIEEKHTESDPRIVKKFINDPRNYDLDDVRRKAYGTFEDDLEDYLEKDQSVMFYNLDENDGEDLLNDLYEEKEMDPNLHKTIEQMEIEIDCESSDSSNSSKGEDIIDMLESLYEEDDL